MNEDFEEQLAQENIAKLKEDSSRGNTRVDEDGTEYEWDDKKQAWFPKIDEDFIAKYQMNYGSTSSTNETSTDAQMQYSKEETERYWKQYYEYYSSCYKDANESSGGNPGDTTNADKCTSEHDEYKHYLDYYAYYNSAVPSDDVNARVNARNTDKGQDQGGNETTQNKQSTKGEKRKATDPPKWFDIGDGKNTNIYVSGLPLDITEQEFSELMNKCGLVMYDPRTRKPKLKLYRDAHGQPKGDGRCCYIKKESVNLAMQILDGSNVRGKTVHVEAAKFEMKGEFDPTKSKKKLTNKEKKKMKEKQEKLFDWHPDKLIGMRPNHEKVIVLKNMFDPSSFEANPALITDLRNDIRLECNKYGDIKKVVVFDRHADGVVMVFYKDAADADNCKTLLNGRWFAKRRIIATPWDGITKYDVDETEEERRKRLLQWNVFLDSDEQKLDPPSVELNISGDSESSVKQSTKSVNSEPSPDTIQNYGSD